MAIDPQVVNQVLTALPYPISTAQLIQAARERGVNNQIMSVLERLPNKTFNSAQDVQNALQSLGNLGGIFKR